MVLTLPLGPLIVTEGACLLTAVMVAVTLTWRATGPAGFSLGFEPARRSSTAPRAAEPGQHDRTQAAAPASDSAAGFTRTTQRKPTLQVDVSTGCGKRAAGR
jgi:hypothetical protein